MILAYFQGRQNLYAVYMDSRLYTRYNYCLIVSRYVNIYAQKSLLIYSPLTGTRGLCQDQGSTGLESFILS